MKAENLDFTEALKFLAERSGIEMPEYDNRSKQNAERRTRIYEMNRIINSLTSRISARKFPYTSQQYIRHSCLQYSRILHGLHQFHKQFFCIVQEDFEYCS